MKHPDRRSDKIGAIRMWQMTNNTFCLHRKEHKITYYSLYIGKIDELFGCSSKLGLISVMESSHE